jgi:hypothetical protein
VCVCVFIFLKIFFLISSKINYISIFLPVLTPIYWKFLAHTFFMSKSKYGKKVLKSVVTHRVCGTCNWWRRNRKGQQVQSHQCVGEQSLWKVEVVKRELKNYLKRVKYIEGDGDKYLPLTWEIQIMYTGVCLIRLHRGRIGANCFGNYLYNNADQYIDLGLSQVCE